ncbi:MAG: Crp/Fnr family transcriptional regulator [Pseudomonadota bacterium]
MSSIQSRPADRRIALFDSLPADLQKAVVNATRRRRYIAGGVIYSQGSFGREMYRIVSGAVRLYHLSDDGHEFVHAVYERGDCFGVSSLIDGEPRAQMAQAQVDTVLEVLTLEAFNSIRMADPAFDRALMLMLIGDVRILIGRVNSVAFEPLPSRLAWRMIKIAQIDADGNHVATLSQAELASMVDASRQRVNTILRQFQAEGLVSLNYGTIIIKDRTRLARKITKP